MTRSGVVSRSTIEDLKIAALTTGARLTDRALARLGGAAHLTVHEYSTTGGIPLRVAGLEMNVPFDEWYQAEAEMTIDVDGDDLVLVHRGVGYPVETVYPLPSYLNDVDAVGNRFGDVVYTHVDRFRVSPIAGCAYDCAFCDMPGRLTLHPVERLLDAAEAALADPALPVRHALISGGSPGPRDEEAFGDTLVQLVTALAPRLEIDVMMSAGPRTPELVSRLVDAGVHGFAINLEVHSAEAAQLHIRGKHRRARPHFDATITAAVDALGAGSGRVRSLVLPGLETVDATLLGLRHIAAMGADPVLSPFRPARGTKLAHHAPVAATVLREVLAGARGIVAEHDVALGPRCIPCQHNTLAFPWDVPAP